MQRLEKVEENLLRLGDFRKCAENDDECSEQKKGQHGGEPQSRRLAAATVSAVRTHTAPPKIASSTQGILSGI
jgi:hypothetical protein